MRFRCPITLPNRLTQLNILLLCNHIVHDIRLSFLFQSSLPQGERLVVVGGKDHRKDFNPRSREGSDPCRIRQSVFWDDISILAPARGATKYLTHIAAVRLFQSSLPRGERLVIGSGCGSSSDFSPRSREGSDSLAKFNITRVLGFQSSLPRGERL